VFEKKMLLKQTL